MWLIHLQQKVKEQPEMKREHGIGNTIKYLLGKVREYDKGLLVFFVTYTLCNSGYSVLNICIIPVLVHFLTQGIGVLSYVGWIVVLLILELLFFLGAQYSYQIYWPRVTRVRLKFLQVLFEKIMSMKYTGLEDPEVQEKIQKARQSISNNTVGVEKILTELFNVSNVVISIVSVSIVISSMNVFFLLFLALFVCIGFAVNLHIGKKNHQSFVNMSQANRKLDYLNRKIRDTGVQKDIRLYDMEEWLESNYDKAVEEKIKHSFQIGKNNFCHRSIEDICTLIRDAAAYSYIIYMVFSGKIGIGEFTFYFMVIKNFSSWLASVMNSIATINQQKYYIDDYRFFVEENERIDESRFLIADIKTPVTIEFDHVSFSYPGSTQKILDDVSFCMEAGKKVALVGVNGAGKTTIVKLLCGLYEPTDGSIKVNGIDIREFSDEEYYKIVSAVFQEADTYAFTVQENIALGIEEEINAKRVCECAEILGLGDKIDSLPKKYENSLSKMFDNEGIELSGGEKQKLALCRLLYKNAPVLVLDEPTAALDPIAESNIYTDFAKLTENKTTLFISHRLASTRFCDTIIFLKNGKIIEMGTHNELLDNNGDYAEMFELQARYYREGMMG